MLFWESVLKWAYDITTAPMSMSTASSSLCSRRLDMQGYLISEGIEPKASPTTTSIRRVRCE